jgi:hypothetical protein
MSSSTSLAPRSLVQELLINRAGPSPDAAAYAAAAAHVYDQAAQALIPLIGEHGVNALADRSLILIRREFPWLTANEEITPEVSPLAQVLHDLQGQAPAVALAAGAALIATFSDLLSTCVGASLTKHLLSRAWRGALSDGAVESCT